MRISPVTFEMRAQQIPIIDIITKWVSIVFSRCLNIGHGNLCKSRYVVSD